MILDKKIVAIYVRKLNVGLNKFFYDVYIKVFCWSFDRLDFNYGGIICFVLNGVWFDGNSIDGFCKFLEEEFLLIYVFNLWGN